MLRRIRIVTSLMLLPAVFFFQSCKNDEVPEEPLFTEGSGVTDNEGNYYETIILDTEEWMAENLRATSYANGDPIANISDNSWGSITTGAWCYYDNDPQYNTPYGLLYNWYAIDDPRKVCPNGWHVASDEEWLLLQAYLGGSGSAGGKMKETGTSHWLSPNTGADNSSGFTGLPGGNRRGATNSVFETLKEYGRHWSSSEYDSFSAWAFDLIHSGSTLNRNEFNKSYGFSCRCVKD